VDLSLVVTLVGNTADLQSKLGAELGPVITAIQAIVIPFLAVLYLIHRFVDHSTNYRVLVAEVLGAVFVLEAVAQGLRTWSGL
jgi:hypothetical protein